MTKLSRREALVTLASSAAGTWSETSLLAASGFFRRSPARQRTYRHVQGLVNRYVAERKIAGALVAIRAGTAPVAFVNAGRLSFDGPTCDADSIYRIYSMSKPITAIAAMQLIEGGRLGIDQPVADFIPEFRAMRVIDRPDTLESHPARTHITVRHLMTHTSGLTYHSSGEQPINLAYRRAGVMPIGRYRAIRDAEERLGSLAPRSGDRAMPPTLDAFVTSVAAIPLISEPGTRWNYGIGLDVLGLVIQRASGVAFDQYLRSHLFGPLDMNDTGFFVAPAKIIRLTTSYGYDPTGAAFVVDDRTNAAFADPAGAPCGGAGIVSSTRDFARFSEMLLSGGTLGSVRVLSRDTVHRSLSNLLPTGVTLPDRVTFGAGGEISPSGAFSSSGGAGTFFWVDPVARMYVVFMTQLLRHDYPIEREIHDAVAAEVSAP